MIVTYLDEDLMVVRDQYGCPDVLQKLDDNVVDKMVNQIKVEEEEVTVEDQSEKTTP